MSPAIHILLATMVFFLLVFLLYDPSSEEEVLCHDQEGRWDPRAKTCGLEPRRGLD